MLFDLTSSTACILVSVFETVRYTCRLRPGALAVIALLAEWGRCRWVWNEAVNQQKTGRKPTLCTLSKLLTAARAANPWLREGSQVAQQQMLRTYAAALEASFRVKGRGRPKLKRRKDSLPSLEYTVNGFSVRGGRLCLPKGISIPVVWSRELPSASRSVRVYRDNLGHWYASFVVTREVVPAAPATGGIGIDWGVTTPATTTDPAYDFPYAGHRKRCAAQVARAQRKMSRRRRPRGGKLRGPQSRGYRQAERQAARLLKKAARQNTHDGRVWAQRVVAGHDVIAAEDFKPKFLAKSDMARKAADSTVGALKRTLTGYGKRAGRKVVPVPPAYTTMTCSTCLARNKLPLKLAERTFRCEHCGYTADRDRNAARVILVQGERILAGADDVRHPSLLPSRVAGGVLSEPEIPRL